MNCNKGKQLVKFKFMRMHRSCQWDNRSAFLVPGHCLAHVKGILLPTVVAQHPPVHYIAKLHSRSATVSGPILERTRKALHCLHSGVLSAWSKSDQKQFMLINALAKSLWPLVTFLQQEEAWPGQSPDGYSSPNKQAHQSSCDLLGRNASHFCTC